MDADILLELQNQSVANAEAVAMLADLQLWIIGGIGFLIGLLMIYMVFRSLSHGI